jgi:hypothetical protein
LVGNKQLRIPRGYLRSLENHTCKEVDYEDVKGLVENFHKLEL